MSGIHVRALPEQDKNADNPNMGDALLWSVKAFRRTTEAACLLLVLSRIRIFKSKNLIRTYEP